MKWLALFLTGIVESLAAGTALSFLWGWFVVPLGAKPIGCIHSIGLMMLLNLPLLRLSMAVNGLKKTGDDDMLQTIGIGVANILITYPLTVLFGWIWHSFM